MSSHPSPVAWPIAIFCGTLLLPATLRAGDRENLLAAFNRAMTAQQRGDYATSAREYERALALAPRVFGPNDQNTATIMNNLAAQYFSLAQYSRAEPLMKRALAISEAKLGSNHLDVARGLNNLAELYRVMGEAQAAPLLQRSLRMKEATLGRDHPDVGLAAANLGDLYAALGQYDEAEPLLLRGLKTKEAVLGPNHPDVAAILSRLADLYENRGQYAKAEPLYLRSLKTQEARLGPDHPEVAATVNNLAFLYADMRQYAQAEPLYLRGLKIKQARLPPDHPDIALASNNLARLAEALGQTQKAAENMDRGRRAVRSHAARVLPVLSATEQVTFIERTDEGWFHNALSLGLLHADDAAEWNALLARFNAQQAAGNLRAAEPTARRMLALAQGSLANQPQVLAASLHSFGLLAHQLGRYGEAADYYRRALAVRERTLGRFHQEVADTLNNLAALDVDQGRYAEAEPLIRRVLQIIERSRGRQNVDYARAMNNLGILCQRQGRFEEAEPLYARSLAIREQVLGRQHADVAASLQNMAALYREGGRCSDAERLCRRALEIEERSLPSGQPAWAMTLNNLAILCSAQGRYADAEPLFKRSLAARRQALGPDHPDVAASLNNLANLYSDQGRFDEALTLSRQSLAVIQRTLPDDHPDLALALSNLAILYCALARHREAEPLFERVLAIRRKSLGPRHPDVAAALTNLAACHRETNGGADSRALFEEALAIHRHNWGDESPALILDLNNLADLLHHQHDPEAAEAYADAAIALVDRPGAALVQQQRSCFLRARIRWDTCRRELALEDLRRALELAEQQRGEGSGAEHETALLFARFDDAFQTMVAWQAELGRIEEAFATAERARARSLLDQLELQGVDLLAGLAPDEARRLRGQEAQAQTRLASLRRQRELADGQTPPSAPRSRQFDAEMAAAQNDLLDVYRDLRTVSQAYHLVVAQNFRPMDLTAIQGLARETGACLWEYAIGDRGSCLFVIAAEGPRLYPLAVEPQQAEVLKIEAGPLTSGQLRRALSSDLIIGERGPVETGSQQGDSERALTYSAALRQVLIPDDVAAQVAGGEIMRLVIVPDGPLTLLPFETLVWEAEGEPRYLLDAAPPISYAPSCTVLRNLVERPARGSADGARRLPVLTVADPKYASEAVASSRRGALGDLSAQQHYRLAGGTLARLPYTANESAWVAEVFKTHGVAVAALRREAATEANVRANVAGRRVVHFACHGLADCEYGNFFGCLALTPGEKGAANPADDGFLTLPEIYELNLKGCELAILSACQTNYGPQQQGEGVWGLSRGFLVAGARRVVASNWLVDDEAAASLVSYYCSLLAKAEKRGGPVDYAAALHAAKRWVRGHEKWQSPYYWGTFVLVGPN